MASLNLKNIYKVYPNGTKAVNDFSMDIEDKEFIVFVGPSGCGKSTVLRMIAGLEEISAGELKIDDAVVNDVDCKNRDTAMVFQNYALYPHMTVADNMAFPLKMAKLTKEQKAELKKRVDEKYPPSLSKSRCRKAAKKEKIAEIKKQNDGALPKGFKLSDEEQAEIALKAEEIYKDFQTRMESNAEVKAKYKEGKKVALTGDDKKVIKERVKEEFPRSLKNFFLKPLHYLTVRHEYVVKIREDRNLQRPISSLNNFLKPLHTSIKKREEMYERVIQIADILGLEEYLGVKPGAMSGGQRQRVALGRAMVRDPKVFLLDEPLSNLDAKLRTQMRSEITKLHNRLQTTFIYVTHDQVEAMTMGDRIVVMKKGRIQQIDTPINLYTYPENLFVAGFIGTPSMNFFDATVESDGKQANITLAGDKKIAFSAECLKKFERKYLGKNVTLGVRPEDFVLAEDGIECVVLNSEMLGSETLLYCDFDTKNVTNYENGKYPFIVKTEGVCLRRSGEIIKVNINFNKAHYFDKESEESVMKRFVSYNDFPVVVSKNKIKIGGQEDTLPPALKELDGDFDAVFPTKAVYEGGNLFAEVLECEELKEGWLARLKIGTQKLYAVFNEAVEGKIKVGINWHEISFSRSGEIVKPTLNTENAFNIKLSKQKLTGEQKKQLPENESRAFDVKVLCGEVSLTCPFNVVKRLLSASDRKLFGVDMQLIFNENALTSEDTFKAKIVERCDYGNKKYGICDCLGTRIVLPIDGEESEVNFGIDLNVASIYDQNLGIKIT